MEVIRKIFSVLSALPAFSSLFKKAAQTGKVDPMECLNALTSISPSTKKVADTAINTVQRGGNIEDAARAVTNIGEVELFGQKVNTQTLIPDLKKAGGVCSTLANMLEKMPTQSPQDIVDFGNAASSIKNWQDIVV